jgi:hypothetical protein
MTFFYDLNKRLAALASKQDAEQINKDAKASAPKSKLAESMGVAEADYSAKKAAAGKDIGKPGKAFAKITKDAGKRYGSKAAGERVAGAVLNKLRHPKEEQEMDESALQAYIGDKKYGKTGMDALRKAGREGANKDKMSQIRNRYNKMDEADEAHKETKLIRDLRSQGLSDKQIIRKMEQMLRGTTKTVKTVAKEGDMEEGNAFTAALKATPKGGKFKVDGKEFTDTSDLEEGFKEMDAYIASREKEKGTGKFDKRITSTGTVYTRKPETFDDPETDPEATGGAPKRRGRPKGKDKGPERVTAKSYKYKAGRPTKTQEDLDSDGVLMTRPSNMSSEGVDHGEYDREGDMAKEQMHTIMSAAKELHSMLRDEENLPEWVQKKITLAMNYIDTARDYMLTQHAERAEEEPIAEKAVSKKQQRFMGMVHAAQKGEKASSPEVGKVAKSMGKKDAEDFAKTKHKGLPEKAKAKKKDESVEETAEAPKEKKSSGGYNFGGGVYESLDRKFQQALTEGMNVSVNMSTGQDGQPTKSINISADGEDADKLADLLKMAGLSGQEQACSTCGSTPCGCESLDENSPDWPTNTETSDNAMQYSGGLNGPKSTGQTTTPVLASQLRRQVSMEEGVKIEQSLFKLYNQYKLK